jgi:hypothetical protein
MTEPRQFERLTAWEAHQLILSGGARPGIWVEEVLTLSGAGPKLSLPADMNVQVLDLSASKFEQLEAPGLRCFELNLRASKIRAIPQDIAVESILNLANCEDLIELPVGLTVGSLNLRGCRSLQALPENLDVWFLDLMGCWSFQHWPRTANIRTGTLNLRGCTAMTQLPDYLGTLAALNVRDCPNLRSLPEGLRITGWIDIAQSGLAETRKLPKSLQGVELRWQGVRVDERIVLRPETITLQEILAEKNVERRRVLLDRFGMSRFMQEAKAQVLDSDTDLGGPRQLLKVDLSEDEPLVALACRCPSTGRQYFLRVPPTTQSCHQAAAWIAGFDDPDDYVPLIET